MLNETSRVYERLRTLDPVTEEYARCLRALGEIAHLERYCTTQELELLTSIEIFQTRQAKIEAEVAAPVLTEETEAKAPEAKAPEAKAPEPIEPSADPVLTPPTEEKPKSKRAKKAAPSPSQPTATEVRDILSKAASNGVKIKTILMDFVPEGADPKLSSVPESAYADLLAREEFKDYAN